MKRRKFLKGFLATLVAGTTFLVTGGIGGGGDKPSPPEPKLPEPKESAGGYPVPSKFAEYLKEVYNAQREHRTMWTSTQFEPRLIGRDVQVSQDGENWVDLDGYTGFADEMDIAPPLNPAWTGGLRSGKSVHYKFTQHETAWEYKNGFPVRYHPEELLEDACIRLPKGFVELDIKGTYE